MSLEKIVKNFIIAVSAATIIGCTVVQPRYVELRRPDYSTEVQSAPKIGLETGRLAISDAIKKEAPCQIVADNNYGHSDMTYLSAKLIESGIPEPVLRANCGLWEFLRSADKKSVISKNRNFRLEDKSGKKWHLKISTDRTKAHIESAANYYLSEHFDFILLGKYEKPIAAEGLYATIQEDAGDIGRRMPIEYWINSLALFHNEAERILLDQGVDIPVVEYRSVEEQQERFGEVKRKTDLRFDRHRLDEAIEYLYESFNKVLIHGDTKRGNLLGKYLIDLECSGKGHPAADLAMIFMQYDIPKERWGSYLSTYLKARQLNCPYGEAFAEMQTALKYAATVVGYREIMGSSLRPMTPEVAKDNQQLVCSLDGII